MHRAVTLARLPQGIPTPADFAFRQIQLAPLDAGQLLCDVRFLSLDPYLRGVISGRHLGHSLKIGEILPGSAVAQVRQTQSTQFAVGDWLVGECGWQEQCIVEAAVVRRLDPKHAPVSTALGVLGMPGLTAWAGITQLAKVVAGDVVLISAALGPVGSTAGQIAKILGARVIGIAGGPEKCRRVREHFGFDDCLDYKAANFDSALAQACPKGIDVYFDNVGGAVLESALARLALHARVILCGLMDQYNSATRPPGPNLGPVIGARAVMMGLVVYDFFPQMGEFLAQATQWLACGKLRWLEDVAHGLDAAPSAFCRLMSGQNLGKALVAL